MPNPIKLPDLLPFKPSLRSSNACSGINIDKSLRLGAEVGTEVIFPGGNVFPLPAVFIRNRHKRTLAPDGEDLCIKSIIFLRFRELFYHQSYGI